MPIQRIIYTHGVRALQVKSRIICVQGHKSTFNPRIACKPQYE